MSKDSEVDIIIVEVGGTVGDIEGQPFLEAIRQVRNSVGRDDTFYVHLTLLPYLGASNELKTKPTQHSVNTLRSMGIQPDAILCRADFPIGEDERKKISLYCDVEYEAVIDLPTLSSVYQVPLHLETQGLGEILMDYFSYAQMVPDFKSWEKITINIPKKPIITADHLFNPTFSPKNNGDKLVVISGATNANVNAFAIEIIEIE